MSRIRSHFGYSVGLVVVALTLAAANVASAESSGVSTFKVQGGKHFGHHGHHPHFGFGFDGGFHASTAAEGFLFGKAAVIDSVGRFRVNDAQANILNEQARALDRENDLLQVKAFHARLQIARQTREAERARRAAKQIEGQQLLRARQNVVHAAVYQLNADELNLVTGEIRWPAVLEAAQFAADRARIEELVVRQARYGADDLVTAEIVRASERLARALRAEIGVLPRAEYLAAQKFLVGLRFASNS
jgi:hypothetical protein